MPHSIDPSSDDATGLPPLDQPIEDDTLWAMTFASGEALVLSPIDRSPVAAFVLSARGLLNDSGGSTWAQMHLALPHGAITGLRDRLTEYLTENPEHG